MIKPKNIVALLIMGVLTYVAAPTAESFFQTEQRKALAFAGVIFVAGCAGEAIVWLYSEVVRPAASAFLIRNR